MKPVKMLIFAVNWDELKKVYKYILLLGVLATGFASCRDFSFSSFMRGDALASVGDKKLYMEDVKALFTADITPEDSLKLLNSYVDLWVKQQLKIQLAEHSFPEEEDRITRMVDDYRNSLLIYEYEKQYVGERLDTVVGAGEINSYYNAHPEEFTLSVPLVKGVVVRFPVGFRQEGQMRAMAISSNRERLQDLIDMCIKNNFQYREFTEWTDAGEIAAMLPRMTESETMRMFSSSPLFEMTQGQNQYFLIVTDLLREGTPTPLNRAEGTIRTMILNLRKHELLRNMEDSLYRSALVKKEVSIHVDTTTTITILSTE